MNRVVVLFTLVLVVSIHSPVAGQFNDAVRKLKAEVGRKEITIKKAAESSERDRARTIKVIAEAAKRHQEELEKEKESIAQKKQQELDKAKKLELDELWKAYSALEDVRENAEKQVAELNAKIKDLEAAKNGEAEFLKVANERLKLEEANSEKRRLLQVETERDAANSIWTWIRNTIIASFAALAATLGLIKTYYDLVKAKEDAGGRIKKIANVEATDGAY